MCSTTAPVAFRIAMRFKRQECQPIFLIDFSEFLFREELIKTKAKLKAPMLKIPETKHLAVTSREASGMYFGA